MNEKLKLQNALNFVKSELEFEENPKMDKYLNYDRIELLKRLKNILS